MTLRERNAKCNENAKNIWQHIHDFFVKVVEGAKEFIDAHIVPVLHFVEAIKAIVDNPGMDFVTALIPGTIDDNIVKALREHLGTVITMLQIEADCASETDLDKRIACFIDHLRDLSPELRDALYHKIASLLSRLSAKAGTEHNFTNAEIDAMVQNSYNLFQHDKV